MHQALSFFLRCIISRLGLKEADFDAVCSAEKEKLGKPYPGVYITTANNLGVPAHQCMAIEDSLNGVIAAKAARMKCVAVPETGTAEERLKKFAVADVMLTSLEGQFTAATWEKI